MHIAEHYPLSNGSIHSYIIAVFLRIRKIMILFLLVHAYHAMKRFAHNFLSPHVSGEITDLIDWTKSSDATVVRLFTFIHATTR
jgi:hypothetical protein